MIYPDEEKITYSYNVGDQLEKVHGYKSYGYDYVDGEVVQHIEYVPFCEVFIEERNNIGIHLIFSMRRNSMRKLDCITMGRGTMNRW